MENNLKQIRNSKNLLQTKVAMNLNITQETISSYETGRVFPSSDMLIKLANYYNTSIDYLLCRTKYNMPIDDIKPNNIFIDDTGKKKVLERSWFARGTLLMVQGFRRGQDFVPKKYKSSIYPVISKINGVGEFGLDVQYERVEG